MTEILLAIQRYSQRIAGGAQWMADRIAIAMWRIGRACRDVEIAHFNAKARKTEK